ncbi:MAG: tetratricopeptide repeat protein [Anaerolineae bacterium]|nr:tetratricopeptide repeat protein [Anaerolineae bacterium]
MTRRPDAPRLSTEHLRRVLAAIANGNPLPATPLREFLVVRSRLQQQDVMADDVRAADYIVTEWLIEEITAALAWQREHYHFPPPRYDSPADVATKALQLDFSQGSEELQAWSLLFFRFARFDLALTQKTFEEITHYQPRTQQRRLNRGLNRLLDRLLASEIVARQAARLERLRYTLPPVPNKELVGRQMLIKALWQQLTSADERRHVFLSGPGGIGKTALSAKLSHRLIDDQKVDEVAWLPIVPGMTVDALLAAMASILGVVPASPEALSSFLQAHRVLLVLDEAEHLSHLTKSDFDRFLQWVDSACLIVTSRVALPALALPVTAVPELRKRDALTLIEYLVHTSGLAARWPDPKRRDLIWRQAGGNPLALGVACQLIAPLPPDALDSLPYRLDLPEQTALLDTLYASVWKQIDLDGRAFWLAAWLIPDSDCYHDLVARIGDLPPERVAHAVHELSAYSLLVLDSNGQRYSLHRTARMFLAERIVKDPETAAMARRSQRRLIAQLQRVPHAAQLVRHLLEISTALKLAVSDRVALIRLAWPDVNQHGYWAVWQSVLEKEVINAQDMHEALIPLRRWLGIACRWLGDHEAAEEHLQEALSLLDRYPEATERANTLIELAVVYRYQGRWQSAQATAQVALADFRALSIADGQERAMLELAQLALDRENPAAALEQLASVQPTAREAAMVCNAYLALGNLQEALTAAERAISLTGQDRPNQARAQATLGRVMLALGRLDEAEDHLCLALELLEQARDLLGWARTASVLAQIHHVQKRPQDALVILQDAAEHQRVLKDKIGLEMTLRLQLTVYASLIEEALKAGDNERSTELAKPLRDTEAEWQTLARKRRNNRH